MKSTILAPWILIGCLLTLVVACQTSPEENAADAESTPAVRRINIKLLVVDDKSLGPVIKRQFSSRRDGEVTLTEMSWDEFASDDFEAATQNDILIYPAWRIGELASRDLLVPITDDNSRVDSNDIRSLLISDRDESVSWGKDQLAMSLGQSHWVALYRQDVLETVGSQCPQTWAEFEKLLEALNASESSDLPTRVAMPLAENWAAWSLLVRSAAAIRTPGKYSNYFNVSSMQPLIESEPFLLSLQAMQNQVSKEPQTPHQILQDFADGKIAIAIVPVNRFWLTTDGEHDMPAFTLAGVPGWSAVFDASRNNWNEQLPDALLSVPLTGSTGMLASASAGTEQQRNCVEVIGWMTSKQISSVISVESPRCGLSRKSHLGELEKWLGDQVNADNARHFADYLTDLNSGRRMLMGLRIPHANDYLNALADAVRAAVLEEKNAYEMLSVVSAEWSRLTDEYGLEKQKQAYRRSEGLQK